MRQKEVKTEKREQKTESEKPKRWLRHTPEGYQFTEAEYALNALGNFLTLIACGKIKLSWSDEVQLKRLTKYLVRMLFKRPWEKRTEEDSGRLGLRGQAGNTCPENKKRLRRFHANAEAF